MKSLKKVLETLQPVKAVGELRAPLRKVEKLIGQKLLELIQAERGPVLAAAEMLGKKLHWRSDQSYGQQLARELLSADLEHALPVLYFWRKTFPRAEKNLLRS